MRLDHIVAVRKNKTIYRYQDMAIKVFNEEYSKPDILNEALNLARVENMSINIPKLLEVCNIEGKWAIVTEFVEGKNLEELMNEQPEKKREYLELFVNTQLCVLMHEAPPMLNRLKEKMKRKIENAPLDETIKYELLARLESMPSLRRLCHGDFTPSNVILREDGDVSIIDWAHVTAGNEAADAGRTYLTFALSGNQKLADEYLDLFSDKARIEKKEIQRWVPILAASQFSKGNKEEQEFLMKWIDVIEY